MPRSLKPRAGVANLLSLGLPDRKVIEGGPPASIRDAFQRLFAEKIEQTNLACQAARRKLKWPQRAKFASERSGHGEGFAVDARATYKADAQEKRIIDLPLSGLAAAPGRSAELQSALCAMGVLTRRAR